MDAAREDVQVDARATVLPAPAASGCLAVPTGRGRSDALLGLQRAAGNRAVGAALTNGRLTAAAGAQRPLARCEGHCHCGGRCLEGEERRPDDEPAQRLGAQLRRAVADRSATRTLQRDAEADDRSPEPGTADALQSATPAGSPNSSTVTDQSHLGPGPDVTDSQAKGIVADFIRVLGPLGATTIPLPSDLMASAELSPAPQRSIQTWPMGRTLQRVPGGPYKLEAGFVGALQLCYDLCTGVLSVNGWLWAGGGVAGKGLFGGESFYGAYVFVEKPIGKWSLDFMPRVACGKCDPQCKSSDDGDGTEFAAGIAGFPIVLKPGERKELKKAGIEAGLLLTPHVGHCSADLELVILIDITQYLGPWGKAVRSAQDLANKWAKEAGEEIDCGTGVVGSGTVHLCKSTPGGGIGGITADSALLCIGGYVGCALGLTHDKASLPGAGH
jgi:hypothetical protein